MSSFNFKEDVTWHDILTRSAIVLATVAIIVWLMPQDGQNYFYVEQGKPWKYADFTAPFDFPIYKSELAVKKEKDSLLKEYEPYFNYNKDIEGNMVRKFVTDHSEGIPGLSDDYISIIANRLHRIYQIGIVSSSDYSTFASDTTRMVRIVNGKNATSMVMAQFLSTKKAYEQLFLDNILEQHRSQLQKCNLNNYIVPNIIYDKDRSEESMRDLVSSVPLASGIAQKGQKIIDRGEIVDENVYRTIESFKKENERRNSDETQQRLTLLGKALYVFVIILFFTIYLTLFRKDYFEKARNVAMLYSLIVIFSLLTGLMVRNTIAHVYIIPYAMVPIFTRVFMDSRTAIITHVAMVLICALMLQHPMEFIVVETLAGMAAVYSLRDLQFRSQLFKTAIIVTIVAMTMNFAFDLIRMSAFSEFDMSYYNYLIINGILLLFAYPLLYLLEKTFGFISDITLIELSNSNNPLLRRMSEVAPGTFQHSIQVGNLASEIANKIGAKAQLVRTGALYHDIGKTINPIYFTENQSGINPHEDLSYIESAQIIISHVTEGLKMAERSGLPSIIKDFICTHHGQGKAKYFYVKYKNEHPDEEVDELLFTYPGPNPFTREQAILMMADATEAASRSLPDYTEKSIRELVNRLIDGMVAEGFFRECPITFRDITYAKTVLCEKLKTIYHARVSYPTAKA
ncbi:HD family phosphohydrolase [Prevotella sp. P2-180]|uniref:HD family phosphohydrolase n=1 Tax=Prevotella sp. P2-180 TaxID=2024224 RepID=UPI000B9718CA|nr:HDIG domain-containing metalloprotein [Prevotella sp. P2-180]MCI7089307.1 HDIG domain-containing protein [Prevotella sp.]OYP61043.1 hydrolase [Prevotella sp. P2-180]